MQMMARASMVAVIFLGILSCLGFARTVHSEVTTLPLYDLGGYMWYTTLGVGTPRHYVNFTVDTGSSDLVVSGTDCKTCGIPLSTSYNRKASSTASIVSCHGDKRCVCVRGNKCGSFVDYGGSINESFTLGKDVIEVGEIELESFIGDVYDIQMSGPTLRAPYSFLANDLLYPEGMFGMGPSDLAEATPLFDEIVATAGIRDAFSIRLADPAVLKLGVGEVSKSATVIPMIQNQFYALEMVDFKIGSVSLGISPSVYNVPDAGCIVDSGTSVPSLPQPAFNALKSGLLHSCSTGARALRGICDVKANETLLDGICYDLSPSEIAAYPTFHYEFRNGGRLTYQPDHYLIPQYYCEKPGMVGLAITPDTDFTVLGASLMKQYDVTFDRVTMSVAFERI